MSMSFDQISTVLSSRKVNLLGETEEINKILQAKGEKRKISYHVMRKFRDGYPEAQAWMKEYVEQYLEGNL